jgi:hypothetical protein
MQRCTATAKAILVRVSHGHGYLDVSHASAVRQEAPRRPVHSRCVCPRGGESLPPHHWKSTLHTSLA